MLIPLSYYIVVVCRDFMEKLLYCITELPWIFNFGPRGVLRIVPTAEYIASNRVTFHYKSKVQSYSYFFRIPGTSRKN